MVQRGCRDAPTFTAAPLVPKVSNIEENLNGKDGQSLAEAGSLEEWMREFQEWVASHDYITAPPADDSRESIYREREDSQL